MHLVVPYEIAQPRASASRLARLLLPAEPDQLVTGELFVISIVASMWCSVLRVHRANRDRVLIHRLAMVSVANSLLDHRRLAGMAIGVVLSAQPKQQEKRSAITPPKAQLLSPANGRGSAGYSPTRHDHDAPHCLSLQPSRLFTAGHFAAATKSSRRTRRNRRFWIAWCSSARCWHAGINLVIGLRGLQRLRAA